MALNHVVEGKFKNINCYYSIQAQDLLGDGWTVFKNIKCYYSIYSIYLFVP